MPEEQAILFEQHVHRSAYFSLDRLYRYDLRVTWGDPKEVVNFLMLNPSTADEVVNDPTIHRQIERTQRWGYGGIIITNLFAWRSTDPSVLPHLADPVGLENDEYILRAARDAKFVMCGWGNHGVLNVRSRKVVAMLSENGATLKALKINSTGEPQHPLYIGYSAVLKDFSYGGASDGPL